MSAYSAWTLPPVLQQAAQAVTQASQAAVNTAQQVAHDPVKAVVQAVAQAQTQVQQGIQSASGAQAAIADAIYKQVAATLGYGSLPARKLRGVIEINRALADISAGFVAALESRSAPGLRSAVQQPFVTVPGSRAYQLMMDPAQTDAADIVSQTAFIPVVAWLAMSNPLSNVAMLESLFRTPNPYTEVMRSAIRIAANRPTGPALVQALVDLAQNLVQVLIGIKVGPLSCLQIGILIVSNLPQPPYMEILSLIARDPVAQEDMAAKHLPPLLLERVIPVLADCMGADSLEAWLDCAESALEHFVPGVVRALRDLGVHPNDIALLVKAIVRSGGNPRLWLDEKRFPGVHDALCAIGAYGLITIADKLNIKNPVAFFSNTVAPLVRQTKEKLYKKLTEGYELLVLSAKVAQQYRGSTFDLKSAPRGFFREVMDALQRTRFDMLPALALLKVTGAFDRLVSVTRDGQPFVSAELKLLLAKIQSGYRELDSYFHDLYRTAGLPTAPTTTPLGADTAAKIPATPQPISTPQGQRPAPNNKSILPMLLGGAGGFLVAGPVGAVVGGGLASKL